MSGISPGEKRWTETGQTERRPAQQELPLFIYINPADISIFPASSRMLNLNPTPFFSRGSICRRRDDGLTDLKQPRPLMRSWRNIQNIDRLCVWFSLFSNSRLVTKDNRAFASAPGSQWWCSCCTLEARGRYLQLQRSMLNLKRI